MSPGRMWHSGKNTVIDSVGSRHMFGRSWRASLIPSSCSRWWEVSGQRACFNFVTSGSYRGRGSGPVLEVSGTVGTVVEGAQVGDALTAAQQRPVANLGKFDRLNTETAFTIMSQALWPDIAVNFFLNLRFAISSWSPQSASGAPPSSCSGCCPSATVPWRWWRRSSGLPSPRGTDWRWSCWWGGCLRRRCPRWRGTRSWTAWIVRVVRPCRRFRSCK